MKKNISGRKSSRIEEIVVLIIIKKILMCFFIIVNMRSVRL